MRNLKKLSVECCSDGYLANPVDWNEDLAREFASEWKGLDFTEDHFPILYFVRSFHAEH